MKIITNNSLVVEKFESIYEVEYIDGDFMKILTTCRDYIHNKYRLLTHPLAGSIKPNETPYKTIMIDDVEKLDTESLLLIEKAIDTTKKFQNNFKTPLWTDTILEDFKVIDLDLIKNVIETVNYYVK
ncbi:GrdX family protein [Tepidibacter hydrothermalis]|uniref:GrdX family protein n=1 Tax=Tepidibacter hydrothermalis TaxID=3036126 RepID=A0ABY8ED81_9FIRM|nr:GrdX family protein [Tepidibacter hydrothermalis]WFD09544.1 GrdX family protein [Tepidibacter hydrothermalis]